MTLTEARQFVVRATDEMSDLTAKPEMTAEDGTKAVGLFFAALHVLMGVRAGAISDR